MRKKRKPKPRNISSSLKSQSTLSTIQQIFRDDLSKSVDYLEQSVAESLIQDSRNRLQDAVEKTKEKQLKSQNL